MGFRVVQGSSMVQALCRRGQFPGGIRFKAHCNKDTGNHSATVFLKKHVGNVCPPQNPRISQQVVTFARTLHGLGPIGSLDFRGFKDAGDLSLCLLWPMEA